MPVYISMLRGINVGGHNKVPMNQLRAMCEPLGFEKVRTFIQSGNVVFEAGKCDPSDLSLKIEKKILSEFGFPVSVITRTPEEMEQTIRHLPFVKESKSEPGKVYVGFLSVLPNDEALKKLLGLATPTEQVSYRGREVYLYYRNGMGQARKLTVNAVERTLQVTATTRNWNTVTKLYAMTVE